MEAPTLNTNLGIVIRRRRLELGLSQDAFADVAGLHRTYIGGIERGERNIGLSNLNKISHALNVPLSRLFLEAERFIACNGKLP